MEKKSFFCLCYFRFYPTCLNDFTIPRIPYSSLTPKQFFDNFVKQRRPCVLTVSEEELLSAAVSGEPQGVAEFAPVLQQWQHNQHLRSSAGHVQVSVEYSETNDPSTHTRYFRGKYSCLLYTYIYTVYMYAGCVHRDILLCFVQEICPKRR